MQKIVVGDLHLQRAEPKHSQTIMFLDWLFSQSFNCKDNCLTLLGDLCNIGAEPELLGIYVDYFENKSKFSSIEILQGNHDCNLVSTILSVFAPLKNVRVITQPETTEQGGISFLYLPFYNHEGKNIKSMKDRYSSLHTEKDFGGTFDYGFGHIEDDTNHFSNSYPDTSKLRVKQWLNGHIHTENVTKKGHYLGSPILDSVTESGKKPLIAVIDIDKNELSYVEVPKFLEYYSVKYPEDLPEVTTPLALFYVEDSIDKEETKKFYSEQSRKKGFEFYARRIVKKKAKKDLEDIGEKDYEEKTPMEYFDDYAEEYKVEDAVADICREIIRKSA